MYPQANLYFSRILPDKKNSAVFQEAMNIVRFRKEVVANLSRIEKEDAGEPWWKDVQLMAIFETLYKSGCILLPKSPVDKLRWIALLCEEISKKEGFPCGNVIIPLDYLPGRELDLYEDVYGVAVTDSIREIRQKLYLNGWEKALAE